MFRRMNPVLRAAIFLAASFVLLVGVSCLIKVIKGEPVEINWFTCAGGAVLVTGVQLFLSPEMRERKPKGGRAPEEPEKQEETENDETDRKDGEEHDG